MPFTLLPEPVQRTPLLVHAWTLALVLHVLLWGAKLLSRAMLLSTLFLGPDASQPLLLWSLYAGPLFVLTWLVLWRRGQLQSPWASSCSA